MVFLREPYFFFKEKDNVAKIFATIHQSVVTMSKRMLFEVKRHTYVTPTNYLELVSGYKRFAHFIFHFFFRFHFRYLRRLAFHHVLISSSGPPHLCFYDFLTNSYDKMNNNFFQTSSYISH